MQFFAAITEYLDAVFKGAEAKQVEALKTACTETPGKVVQATKSLAHYLAQLDRALQQAHDAKADVKKLQPVIDRLDRYKVQVIQNLMQGGAIAQTDATVNLIVQPTPLQQH